MTDEVTLARAGLLDALDALDYLVELFAEGPAATGSQMAGADGELVGDPA